MMRAYSSMISNKITRSKKFIDHETKYYYSTYYYSGGTVVLVLATVL